MAVVSRELRLFFPMPKLNSTSIRSSPISFATEGLLFGPDDDSETRASMSLVVGHNNASLRRDRLMANWRTRETRKSNMMFG